MDNQILENDDFKDCIEKLTNYNIWLKDETESLSFDYSPLSLVVDDNAISEILDTISTMAYVIDRLQEVAVKLEEMEGVK